jgi:hypothetical protein
MTPERLAEIRAREQAATKGPWSDWDSCCVWYKGSEVLCEVLTGESADQAFIAHARTDIPELLAEVERLAAENAQLKDRLLTILNLTWDAVTYSDAEGALPIVRYLLDERGKIARLAMLDEPERQARPWTGGLKLPGVAYGPADSDASNPIVSGEEGSG